MICPKCNAENPEGSKFCTNCGAPLEQPQQAAPEQPAQQPTPEQPVQQPIPEQPVQQPIPEQPAQQPQREQGYQQVESPYYYSRPYGTQPVNDPYGARPANDPYGARPANDPYGARPANDPYGTHPVNSPYMTAQPAAEKKTARGSIASLILGIFAMLVNFTTFTFTMTFWAIPLALEQGTFDLSVMNRRVTGGELLRAAELAYNVCGFFAICAGVIATTLGVLAIVFGVKARRSVRLEPNVYKGGGTATAGRVTGILALVGVALCILLSLLFYVSMY